MNPDPWMPFFQPYDAIYATNYGESESSEKPYTGGIASQDGRVRLICTWTKDWDEEELPPAPEQVSVIFAANGYAEYLGPYPTPDLWIQVGDDVIREPITQTSYGMHLQAGRAILLSQHVPTGATSVELSWQTLKTYSEAGDGVAIDTTQQPTGYATAFAVGYEDTLNRSVQISSSTIEDSYFKVDDVALPLLGTLVPSDYRADTPQPPTDGPYAIKYKRANDGTMTVDSAVAWDENGQKWVALENLFTAQAANFTAPSYHWQLTGDGTPLTIGDEAQLNSDEYGLPISLGFGSASTGFPKTNQIKVAITDADGAIGSNSYTVNWHLPLEGTALESEIDHGQNLDENASDWDAPLQRSITVTTQPRSIWWDIAGAATGYAAVGTTMLFPEEALATRASAALTGANFTITSTQPSATTENVNFSYAEYADAVTKQYNKNHNEPGTENDQDTVFSNSLSGEQFGAYVDELYNSLTDAAHAGDDPNYQNAIYQSRIVLMRKWHTNQWHGDQYDTHGYQGVLVYPISEEFQFLNINQVKVP